jgi:hypothetical protein
MAEALELAGPIEHYMHALQNVLADYIAMGPIHDLCVGAVGWSG